MSGWNSEPQGVYPAATGVQFHGSELPHIAPNPDFGYVQDAIKAVGDYFHQKKTDDIANQILATDNSQAGQLGQQIGGAEGLKASDYLRQRLQDQQTNDLATQLKTAQIQHLLSEGSRHSGGGGGSGVVGGAPPTWTDPNGIMWSVNGNGTLGHKIGQAAGAPPASGLSPLDQRREQIIQETERKAKLGVAREGFANEVGVPPNALQGVTQALSGYVPGQTPFPAIGTHAAIADDAEGPYKDRILSAYGKYKDALSGGTAAAAPAPAMSTQDQQAAEWAAAHPDDPRAAAIKERLGLP